MTQKHSISFQNQAICPAKIICIGRNYVAHAEELGNAVLTEPVIFLKPASSIAQDLRAHRGGESLHFETELCLLMGDTQESTSQEPASGVIGLGLGLDLTKREKQSQLKAQGLPWERSKAFDGAAIFTEFVALPANFDWSKLSYTLHIDGQLRQQGQTELMIFSPPQIIEDLRSDMPAQPHDIIMTGTPSGVGPVPSGSTFEVALYHEEAALLSHKWTAR